MTTERSRVLRYFRYHHHHTYPGQRGHNAFMNALNYLEAVAGMSLSDGVHDPSYALIKDALRSLSPQQMLGLATHIKYVTKEK